MGTSASSGQLGAKLAGFGTKMPAITRRATGEAALAAKVVMLAEAAAANSSRLSGVGKSGAKIGVGFNVRGGVNATAIVSYRGPAHLANNPRKGGYEIKPKTRGRNAKRALSFNGSARATSVGGATRGKKFFEASQPKVAAQTPVIFNRELNRGLRSVF